MNKIWISVIGFIVAVAAIAFLSFNEGECQKDDAVMKTIMTRRSIRDYKEEPVCREVMAEILQCGIYAPSAMNMQTWAVRVVDNKEFIDGVRLLR